MLMMLVVEIGDDDDNDEDEVKDEDGDSDNDNEDGNEDEDEFLVVFVTNDYNKVYNIVLSTITGEHHPPGAISYNTVQV